MTNIEKFKEVFGYEPDTSYCIAPQNVCDNQAYLQSNEGDDIKECEKCPFNNWWNKEYLSCFELKKR